MPNSNKISNKMNLRKLANLLDLLSKHGVRSYTDGEVTIELTKPEVEWQAPAQEEDEYEIPFLDGIRTQ